jgi:hypothetical protein
MEYKCFKRSCSVIYEPKKKVKLEIYAISRSLEIYIADLVLSG